MTIGTHALRQHAEELQKMAKDAQLMADELEKLPDPIGEAVTKLAALLARHGLCVIHKDALRRAEVCMAAFEADGMCEQVEHERALSAVQLSVAGGVAP